MNLSNKRKNGKLKNLPFDSEKPNFRSFIKQYWAAILVFLISLLLFFPYDKSSGRFDTYPKTGEVSKETIIAPFSFDIMKTEQELSSERERINQRILPIFIFDSLAVKKMTEKIDSVIQLTSAPQNDTVVLEISKIFIENPQILPEFKTQLLSAAKKGLLNKIVAATDADGEKMQRDFRTSKNIVRSQSGFIEILNEYRDSSEAKIVSADSLKSIFEFRSNIAKDMSEKYSKNGAALSKEIFALAEKIALPTLIYDQESHQQNIKNALSSINPVKETIIKDVAIVRQYQLVTGDISRTLEVLNDIKIEKMEKTGAKKLADNAIIFVLIITFAAIAVIQFGKFIPQFLSSKRYFLSIAIICAIQFFLVWLTLVVFNIVSSHDANSSSVRIWEVISWGPMLTATLLSSLVFNRRSGLLLSLFFAMYYMLISQFSVVVPLSVLIIGGFVSHFAQKIRYRKHLLWLIVGMLAANILIELLIMFLNNTLSAQSLLVFFAAPCLNVIISAGIVFLALPLFEYMFGITTVMTLLELADLSNPLLKRLAIEAPGTFNHSLAVGNLAELAAVKVGADPLLCRVLAYYHDVGKINNPIYFTENQLDKKNPHDKLTPARSANILKSHVSDGCDLIDEYKLPKILKNGIIQHHGTGLAGFFYDKALELKKEGEVINPADFSYQGEKPQTKETAILMLADKVEAMSKSLRGDSESDLRKKINDNVRKIVVSGQLDECGLTFRNVFEIINGFMPALKGIFHERIEYQEESKNGKV